MSSYYAFSLCSGITTMDNYGQWCYSSINWSESNPSGTECTDMINKSHACTLARYLGAYILWHYEFIVSIAHEIMGASAVGHRHEGSCYTPTT